MKIKNKLFFVRIFAIICVIVYEVFSMLFIYNENLNFISHIAIEQSNMVKNIIDVDKYSNLIEDRQKDEYYYYTQSILSEIQAELNAEYIYVERYVGDDTIEYIFDSKEDCFGDQEKIEKIDRYQHKSAFVENFGTTDAWSDILTGYAPLLNEHNEVIGLVGIDYSKSYFNEQFLKTNLYKLYLDFILLFSMAILIVLIEKKDFKNQVRTSYEFYEKLVETLATSINKKSDYTLEHSNNVAIYAVKIGKKIGLKHHQLDTLKWAAVLHDVGKIGIPEYILNKKERLSEEEYDIIKQHPLHSADILSCMLEKEDMSPNSTIYKDIIDVALHHHERWDGMGYPHNLHGREISLYSRIVCVADAFEAMTAIRPYKKSMTIDMAIVELNKNKDKQFDSYIVDILVEILKKEK